MAHALLSPSAASRWMHCTAAPRLEAPYPDSGSEYAKEGTLAHALAELKLRKALVEPAMSNRKYNNAHKKLQEDPHYDPEMEDCTDGYLDYIQEIVHSRPSAPYVAAEVSLDITRYIPEGRGTADCVILHGGELWVIDYKHGKGVKVDAPGNPQTRIYGLGALAAYDWLYPITMVHMAIYQPRLSHVSTEDQSADELRAWGETEVAPKARQAYDGPGETHAGDWCRWCKFKRDCRVRALDALTPYDAWRAKDAKTLDPDDYAKLLPLLDKITAWCGDIADAALEKALAGVEIPGYKAVEGRSVRRYTDTDQAMAALRAAGYDEALLYERRPITLAAAEKLVGKGKFGEIIAPYIMIPPGKPTLVPLADKRAPLSITRPTAAEDFGGDNHES